MANEKSIFEQIIKDDPDNLLKVDLRDDVTQDSTLIDSFREINNFYEKYDKEPSANKADFYEFQLYASLKNIREDKKKIKILSNYDKYNLLDSDDKKIESLKDIFNDDSEGLLNDDKKLKQIQKLNYLKSNSEYKLESHINKIISSFNEEVS